MIKDGLLLDSQLAYAKCQPHLIPQTNKTSRSQIKMQPKYITIHNTGNRKADALANSKYVDTAFGYISWHFTVDDKVIYQELPIDEVAWHAGDGNGQGNYASIGIEICEHIGINWDKAKANAIALIVTLMKDLNIPITNVVPHKHWSGKYCPHKILDEGWNKFVDQIKLTIEPKTTEMREDWKYEKIRFKGHTDVHVFKSKKAPNIVLGTRFKQESLPDIINQYKDVICATNAGMFNYDGKTEHLGLLITDNGGDEKLYYQPSSPNFVDMIAWKDGSVTVEVGTGMVDRLVIIQRRAHWGIGTSYALMVNGYPSSLNWDKFSHTKESANRTILGYDSVNKIWYSIVADGRTKADKGLTAKEQVELCQQLGITDACNLDGGGSSDMEFKGKIVTGNYKAERKIGTAIIYQ